MFPLIRLRLVPCPQRQWMHSFVWFGRNSIPCYVRGTKPYSHCSSMLDYAFRKLVICNCVIWIWEGERSQYEVERREKRVVFRSTLMQSDSCAVTLMLFAV